jgi:hypothetical protein
MLSGGRIRSNQIFVPQRKSTQGPFNRLLDRAANFTISEKRHGAPENRVYECDLTFIRRGLSALHVEFTPIN